MTKISAKIELSNKHCTVIKNITPYFFFLFTILFSAVSFAQVADQNLKEIFMHPPENAKPGVLWMWMGSNISKEGITKDLEALKKEGFNSATLMSLSDITIPWPAVIYNSPTPQFVAWSDQWWEMVRFAAQESKRLGISFGMHNCPGYESSGGVWIKPEMAMKELCWNQTTITGNGKKIIKWLSRPLVNPRSSYTKFNIQDSLVEYPVIPARSSYFKDIAVIAVPDSRSLKKEDVLDLTDLMKQDGTLEWNAPMGQWTIYRFGYTITGALIQPAQPQATGFECDKMNEQAVNFHLDNVLGGIEKHLGDLVGTGFNHLYFDSYEAGYPNWTQLMPEEFRKRRGYSLIQYLPIFAGKKIGSSQDSLKFISDFAATIKDLYRDVYFKTISNRLKAVHIMFSCEPYGAESVPWRSREIAPFINDVMTEFWTDSGKYTPYELNKTMAAARAAGKNVMKAESFTGMPSYSMWSEYPAWIKPIGDAAFCAGVNNLILHRFTHQPWDDKYKPGNSMGQWGTHFDRTQTWWEPGKAMIEYWQRCQSLLQWGNFVPDTSSDLSIMNLNNGIEIRHIHRADKKIDLYFLANTSHNIGYAICKFNAFDRIPEIWDPVNRTIKELHSFTKIENRVECKLKFEASQSYFIVLKAKDSSKEILMQESFPNFKDVMTLRKPWSVTFDHTWGGPQNPIIFKQLKDWTQSLEKGIKYYSGTASYATTFNANFLKTIGNKQLFIDLGKVNYIASIKVNDRDLGVIWTAPWRIEIPQNLLKEKNNSIIIKVTNTWANRLIGDEQEPEDMTFAPGQNFNWSGKFLKKFPDWFLNNTPRPSKKRYCFTTWNYFDKDSPLMPSGLLGPVRILKYNN